MPTLDFKGKSLVYSHHLSVPARTLEPDAKKPLPLKGSKPSLDDNLIIHGDNLHALKALMPRYADSLNGIFDMHPQHQLSWGHSKERGELKWAWILTLVK